MWKNHLFSTAKPNERSCRFFGIFCKVPPYLPDCLQNAITLFLFGLCWVWRSMLDKSIHFVCFPKKFEFVCFPPFLLSFFKKIESFFPKIAYIGGKQTNSKKTFLNEKFECFRILDAFSSAGCTKSFKFERVMIVQAHPWWGKWKIFLIFPQKAVIYTKLLLFLEKLKNFHFPQHGCVLEQS